jgi:alginate O-acetyltransferase complex protein AlgJ
MVHGINSLLVVLLLAPLSARGAEFRTVLAGKAAELRQKETPGFPGADGYYFLGSELRHYASGPFWGEAAAKVSSASANHDPLPAILDFHAQLKKAGIQLIFIPVPGKVAVYPDKAAAALVAGPRQDSAHQEFYALLRRERPAKPGAVAGRQPCGGLSRAD